MTRHVVYFTRTGNSKRVAEKLAKRLTTEAIAITDNKNWQGFFGYIKAGFYASSNKTVKITVAKPLENRDQIIVVSPLWAGDLSPAVREFFKLYPKETTHLVVTSGGSKIKQRDDYKSVTDITKKSMNEDEQIDKLIEMLS